MLAGRMVGGVNKTGNGCLRGFFVKLRVGTIYNKGKTWVP